MILIAHDTIIRMRRSFLNRPVDLLGQALPMASLILIGLVVLGSALLAFASRLGVPALALSPLSPPLVMSGQVWRLLTWAFFETDGQSLVFGGLMLGFSGRDLVSAWGGAKYLSLCAAIAFVAGAATTAIGFVWPDVYATQYLSIWPLVDALMVGWALLFPNRTILFMFVLPAGGRNLLYLTVGMTVLFAVMYGFSNFVPHFLAMGLMYAYIRGGSLIGTELRLRSLLNGKRDKRGLRVVEGGWNKDAGRGPNGSGWVH